jgi:uncharacterized protein (TIGR04222 family)
MCHEAMQVSESYRGKTVKCSGCDSYVEIPSAKIPADSAKPSASIRSSKDVALSQRQAEAPQELDGANQRIFHITVAIGVVAPMLIILVVLLISLKAYIDDPIEMLRQIPGPKFLVLFIVLIGTCIGIGWLWVNADRTKRYPLPGLTYYHAFVITALRGGRAAVIRTAVFSLWIQKLVEIEKVHRWWWFDKFEVTIREHELRTELNPIELEIHQFLHAPRSSRDLFRNASLKYRIERYLEPVYGELEELHLMRTKTEKDHAWMVTITIASVIAVLGGTKLYLGLTHGKSSMYLFFLLPVSLISLFVILKPWGTLTQLGRHYLKVLKDRFAWMMIVVDLDRYPEGVDPTLSIAIFGISVLGGTAMYESFCEAFPLGQIGGGCSGGCSGGCGGGCGGGG